MITGKYPGLRLRRNRKLSWARRLVQENTLSPSDFILPIFLIDGTNKKESINTMPGVYILFSVFPDFSSYGPLAFFIFCNAKR